MARVGNVPVVSAYKGNIGQQMVRVGERLDNISEEYKQKQEKELAEAKKMYAQGLNINLYQSINELRNNPELSSNPQGLSAEMDKVLEKTLSDVDDDDVKMAVMVDYQLKKGTYINHAQTEFNRIQREKARSYAFDTVYANIDSMGESLANVINGTYTDDDIVNFQHSAAGIEANINAKDIDGTYIFTDSQRRQMLKDAKKQQVTAFKEVFDNLSQDDKDTIRESINKDTHVLLRTDKGDINIKDVIGGENYAEIKKFVNDEEYKRVSLEAKKMRIQETQQKIDQFNTESALSEELDNMNISDALRLLDEKQGIISDKYYKAKQKALLSAKGISAETRAETATDLYMQAYAINTEDVKEFFKQSSDVLAKIEEEYANGNLSLTDKRALEKNLKTRQGKAIPDYIDKTDSWFFYDAEDAMIEFKNNFLNIADANNAMLEYIRISGTEDLSSSKKKALVKSIIDSTKKKMIDKLTYGISVGEIRGGYRYKGGNPNEESSWEKI